MSRIYSAIELAQIFDRSVAWVTHTAKEHNIGKLISHKGTKKKIYNDEEKEKLQKLITNKRRFGSNIIKNNVKPKKDELEMIAIRRGEKYLICRTGIRFKEFGYGTLKDIEDIKNKGIKIEVMEETKEGRSLCL